MTRRLELRPGVPEELAEAVAHYEDEATAEANKRRSQAQAEADAQRIGAEAAAEASFKEAEAIKQLAAAERLKGLALAEVRRAMVDAENAVSDRLLLRDVALKALDIAPDLARELMLPAQKITEIKVLQANGIFGGQNGDGASSGAMGAMSPIMKTLMEAGAAYPLVRELMAFGKVDGAQLTEKAQDVLGSLGGEIQKVLSERSVVAAPPHASVVATPPHASVLATPPVVATPPKAPRPDAK